MWLCCVAVLCGSAVPAPALPPRCLSMLSGLLTLLLSVTDAMGADAEVSRSPLVRAMAASEKEQQFRAKVVSGGPFHPWWLAGRPAGGCMLI